VVSFRWFKPAAGSFVKVPFFGAVSYLTLAVCPFCIVFAVLWAVYRRMPYAWIGQDVLVSADLFSSFYSLSLGLFSVD
jgi:hypothetical protein